MTTGVADDRDRSARSPLARKSGFSRSGRRKAMAVYWMTATVALAAPVMNAVFFIIPPSVEILLNLARPFTACISSALPSTGCIVEEAQTQRAM